MDLLESIANGKGGICVLSILQGLFNKKSGRALNELVLKAKQGDEKVMNDLLIAYTPFMKKTASFICKRFIDEHDDEFSIAMSGFHEAVINFDPDDNSALTTFSHMIMKRRLIDHMRKETIRNKSLYSMNPADGETDFEVNRLLFDESSIASYSREQQAVERRIEIGEYSKLLKEYGLSFYELVELSPKHVDSRKMAFQIAQIIADTPEFYEHLKTSKRLPMKEIEALVEVSRKTLERHRKYIIAVTLLLNSRFVYIKDYIKGEI